MGDTSYREQDARLRALVKGWVQGVNFRDFTRYHGRRLGLGGWVRNLSDGTTVEVMAEGPRATLDKLLDHLRGGPPGTAVLQVDAEWMAAQGDLPPFHIR